jgi:hypothetical protein
MLCYPTALLVSVRSGQSQVCQLDYLLELVY